MTKIDYNYIQANVPIYNIISKYVKLTPLKSSGGKQEWQGLCPFHNEKTPSFQVVNKGGTGQFFHCKGCNEQGNVIIFYAKMHSLTNPQARDELARNHLNGADLKDAKQVEKEISEAKRKQEEQELKLRKFAFDLWQQSDPITKGSPAYKYLFNARGVDDSVFQYMTANVKENPQVMRKDSGKSHAIVCRGINMQTKETKCGHRTYIKPDGSGKVAGVAKQAISATSGSVFPVYKHPECDESVMYISEGLEDFLSYAQLYPKIRGGFVGGCSNIRNVLLPDDIKRVVIIGDNHALSVRSYGKAGDVLREKGIVCDFHFPPSQFDDFNDYILTLDNAI